MCGTRKPHQQPRDDAASRAARRAPEATDRFAVTGNDRLRASDAERDAAAAELQVHAAAGRLDVDELDERMSAVLTARTRADIGGALEDLPETSPAAATPAVSRAHGANAYLAVIVLLVTIWVLSGGGHFWPLYPAIGWGLPLLINRSRATTRPGSLTAVSESGPR